MKETDQVYMHIPLWVQTYENEDGRLRWCISTGRAIR